MRVSPERLDAAFDLVRAGVARGTLPVGLLAVATRDEILRREAYGPRGPIGTDGIYLLASISKPIVSTAIMQLVEQGKLLLDEPVARYIPEFGVRGKEDVRIWHLLTHTSGLDSSYQELPPPSVGADQTGEPPRLPTPADDLRGVCWSFLRFPPGSRFEYCNVSFRILGEIVTRLSGLPYPEYLARHVFAPAGMTDTTFDPFADAARAERALPVHDFPDFPGGLPFFVSMLIPAGGLYSTAADLVALGQAYLNGGRGKNGRVLGPMAISTMTRRWTEGIFDPNGNGSGAPTEAHWGLGWALSSPRRRILSSASCYGHGGATGTHLLVDPEAGLVVVFLTNRWDLPDREKSPILNAVFGAVE